MLTQRGIHYAIFPFLDRRTHRILYQRGHTLLKALGIIGGLLRRVQHIVKARHATYVFIHREATPVGPPWVEWLLTKVLRRKIIYDFDDAIWLTGTSQVNPLISLIKWPSKVSSVCRWSNTVSAGNAYLADFARQYASRVIINPTTIDTEHHHQRLQDQSAMPVVIGWTGSHSTLKYLDSLVPILQQLAYEHRFRFLVITDRPPKTDLSVIDFVPWQQDTEVDDLLRMHIGVMPLPDDPWAQGKCGFKALQYMAVGIPAVVSPVGVNARIVTHGVEGYHCMTDEDWYQYLATLLTNTSERTRMGRAGREKVVEQYSVKANTENFLELFAT